MTARFAVALSVWVFTMKTADAELSLWFPRNEACGLVTVCRAPGELGLRGKHDRVIGHATGEVKVSPDDWILLELKAETELQRRVIRSLPKEGIRGLRITGGQLDRQTIKSMSAMTSLELLDFRGCTLLDNAFENAAGLPKLGELNARVELSKDAVPDMVRWIIGCPQLEYLYWVGRSGSWLPKHAWGSVG